MSSSTQESAEMRCNNDSFSNPSLSAPGQQSNVRIDVTKTGKDYHGHQIKDKRKGIIRLGFININSLSKNKSTAKYNSIKQGLAAAEIDIFGLTETNKSWHLMPPSDTWNEIAKTWWKDSHRVISYNSRDISSSHLYQPGGTILTTINQYAHRVQASGVDDSKLGRWTWVSLQGKHDINTTIFSVYCPCKSTQSENTTYSQHLRYFNICQRNVCPRTALLEDLKNAIEKF